MENYDLPLLSNIEDVRVKHYLIELYSDFLNKCLHGTVILFFDATSVFENSEINCENTKTESRFPIILECSDIVVESVQELHYKNIEVFKSYISSNYKRNGQGDFHYWSNLPSEKLSFTQSVWSLEIQKENLFTKLDFPKILIIKYITKPEGNSLSWRELDDGSSCFFTCGSSINNRSLLPCQDRPTAMATWQSWIYVQEKYIVSMTGDEEPIITNGKKKDLLYYFFTSMVVPISTIAIAAGQWERIDLIDLKDTSVCPAITTLKGIPSIEDHNHDMKCKRVNHSCHLKKSIAVPQILIPVSLLVPRAVKSKAKELLQFIKYILLASYQLLGNYPFKRLQLVILPRCFPSLGLASPNIIYLSKSVLIDDSFLYIRLAHEISHSWFGITIGPKNWQEEWLSEGFTTYLEDIIYVLALKECETVEHSRNPENFLQELSRHEDFFHLRAHIRYKMLINELENSNEELQILSPIDDPNGTCSLSNSLNPEKSFLQVHYLKGYFLLEKLSKLVTRSLFIRFIHSVVHNFHGQLVTSSDIIDFFFQAFPTIELKITKTEIIQDWLSKPKINLEITTEFEFISTENPLMKVVNDHIDFWQKACKLPSFISNSSLQQSPKQLLENSKISYSDQIVLILENLINMNEVISSKTLKNIHSFYRILHRNADIIHRWCELLIKNKHSDLTDVKKFVMENQSMGVYLYGELMISGKKSYIKLAKEIYNLLQDELDLNAKKVIFCMINGKELK